ncbi:MAG: class I SAM-dependent methyltransferase [Thermodesulfobacteriota bacterium]|jgi:SAM-dependent methyltransferase
MKYDFLSKLSLLKHQAFQIKALKKEQEHLKQKCRQFEALLAQTDYLPIPPQELIVRVDYSDDVDLFLGVGRIIFWDLKRLLFDIGKNFESFHSILDFGCGCGRVTRFLRPTNHQVITGMDIDPESIGWCKANLSHIAEFETINFLPPLPYTDNSIDFIFCISVFTHLPEDMQFQWLEELRRITKPQGIFIASIHGEGLLPTNDSEVLNNFTKNGFVYIKGGGTKGLPDFYQTTYHAKSYIDKNWSRYFNILNIQTRAIGNYQDGIVCQKV